MLPELLRAAWIERPVLVGHSDGGSIALIHAARHPVERLDPARAARVRRGRHGGEHRGGARDVRDHGPRRADGAATTATPSARSGSGTTSGSRPSSATGTSRTCCARRDGADAADPGRARPVRDAGPDRRDRARHQRPGHARRARLPATRRTWRRPRRRWTRPWSSCHERSRAPLRRRRSRHSFDAHYGLEFLSPTHGRVTLTPEHLGADGTVRSGVYAAIAESLASTGTAVEVVPQGFFPSGLSNSTHVVGDAREGVLEARRPLPRAGRAGVAVGRRDRPARRRADRDRDGRDRGPPDARRKCLRISQSG